MTSGKVTEVVRGGAVGAGALAAAQRMDMRVTKREPSEAPLKLVKTLSGWEPRRAAVRTVVGYTAQSTIPLAAAAVMSSVDAGPAKRFAGAWVVTVVGAAVVDLGFGVVEPPWRWSRAEWVRELALKGAMAAGVTLGTGSRRAVLAPRCGSTQGGGGASTHARQRSS